MKTILKLFEMGKSLTNDLLGCKFHQRFTREFFVRMLFWQLFSCYMYIEKAAKMTFVRKICM